MQNSLASKRASSFFVSGLSGWRLVQFLCHAHEPVTCASQLLQFFKLNVLDCSNVWANTTEKNIRKLQAVQNYACRIVSGARKYDRVTPHLKSLSWLPVKDQLYYRQATMAFKRISGHAPKYLTSQFITREQVTKRTTRSGQKLDIPFLKTASGQRTFYYRTIGLWNNLDPSLKSSCSVQVFKRILKNKLLDNFVNTP